MALRLKRQTPVPSNDILRKRMMIRVLLLWYNQEQKLPLIIVPYAVRLFHNFFPLLYVYLLTAVDQVYLF